MLNHYYELFKAHLIIDKQASTHTVNAYTTDVLQFITFLHECTIDRFEDIDAIILEDYYRSLFNRRLSPRSIVRKSASLKAFFTYCREMHNQPCLDIASTRSLDTTQAPIACVSEELQSAITRAAADTSSFGQRTHAILITLLHTTLTIDEIRTLALSHIDCKQHKIHPFGTRKRAIYLDRRVYKAIEAFVQNIRPALVALSTNKSAICDTLFPAMYGIHCGTLSRHAIINHIKRYIYPEQHTKAHRDDDIKKPTHQHYATHHPRG